MTGCGLLASIALKSILCVVCLALHICVLAKFFHSCQGFLHGAWFEGRDAGQELAACIKGGGCAYVREHFDEVVNARPYKVDQYNTSHRR